MSDEFAGWDDGDGQLKGSDTFGNTGRLRREQSHVAYLGIVC